MMLLCSVLLLFIGLLFLQRSSYFALIFGLLLISNAINMLIFFGSYPDVGGFAFTGDYIGVGVQNDALPQALVLTAIVIGFALLGFVSALVAKVAHTVGDIDSEQMRREQGDDD